MADSRFAFYQCYGCNARCPHPVSRVWTSGHLFDLAVCQKCPDSEVKSVHLCKACIEDKEWDKKHILKIEHELKHFQIANAKFKDYLDNDNPPYPRVLCLGMSQDLAQFPARIASWTSGAKTWKEVSKKFRNHVGEVGIGLYDSLPEDPEIRVSRLNNLKSLAER